MIQINKLFNRFFAGKYTMVILPAIIGLLSLSLAFGLMYLRAKESMKPAHSHMENK